MFSCAHLYNVSDIKHKIKTTQKLVQTPEHSGPLGKIAAVWGKHFLAATSHAENNETTLNELETGHAINSVIWSKVCRMHV